MSTDPEHRTQGTEHWRFSAADARAEIALALNPHAMPPSVRHDRLLGVIAYALVELVESQNIEPDFVTCGVCGHRFNRALAKVCPHCAPEAHPPVADTQRS
jgi:hypothetical protein